MNKLKKRFYYWSPLGLMWPAADLSNQINTILEYLCCTWLLKTTPVWFPDFRSCRVFLSFRLYQWSDEFSVSVLIVHLLSVWACPFVCPFLFLALLFLAALHVHYILATPRKAAFRTVSTVQWSSLCLNGLAFISVRLSTSFFFFTSASVFFPNDEEMDVKLSVRERERWL